MYLFQKDINLTPVERATRKAIEGTLFTVGVAAGDAALQYITSAGSLAAFNWSQLAYMVMGAILASLGYTANKLRTAPHDAPLSPASDAGPAPTPVATDGPLVVIHTHAPAALHPLSPTAGTTASMPLTFPANMAAAATPMPTYTTVTYGTSAGPAPIILTRGNTPPVAPTVTPSSDVSEAGPAGEEATQTPG